MEIWSTQYAVMSEAMATCGAKPKDIAGIGITNQRETTIVWDKETGELYIMLLYGSADVQPRILICL